MPQPELDRLLISNLGDLEAAALHLTEDLQPAMARALDEKFNAAMERSGWKGKADFENNYSWIAPPEWERDSEKAEDFECWFEMNTVDANREEAVFWLSLIVGAGTRQLGLRWVRQVGSPRKWRSRLREQVEIISRLRSRGFSYQEASASFFLPVHVDRDALANAFGEESPELALGPFEAAVQTCIQAKEDFNALLAATPQE